MINKHTANITKVWEDEASMADNKKNNKQRLKKIILYCLLVCLFSLVMLPFLLMIINPMRRPESMITNYVLRRTPIGMDMEEVIILLENHRNWDIRWINYERGFPHPRPHTLVPRPDERPFIVGDKSIRVDAGRFWPADTPIIGFFMETIVSIFWGFDEDGRLIEVYVWKSSR